MLPAAIRRQLSIPKRRNVFGRLAVPPHGAKLDRAVFQLIAFTQRRNALQADDRFRGDETGIHHRNERGAPG